MPARLPDEELAPVEGAAPPQAAVAPTELGLNSVGEALGQAATVGYRAAAIATKAQAQADERAVAPTLTSLQGDLNGVASKGAAAYQGEPGYVPAQQAAGQKVLDGYSDQRAAMTPGQQAQFDRHAQSLMLDHQATALKVQNVHQATAIETETKAQDTANLNGALVPTLTKMQQLDKGLASTAAGDPGAVAAYRAGSNDVAAANWASFAASSGLPQWQLDALKPQYDLEVQKEQLNGASRLGDAQATYATSHLVQSVLPTVTTAVNAVATDPTLFGPAMAPGGTIEKSVAALGTGETHDQALDHAKAQASEAYIGGLIREKQYGLAQSELDSNPTVNQYLPADSKRQLENEVAAHGPAAGQDAAEAYTFAQTSQVDVAMRAAGEPSIFNPQQVAEMQRVMSPEAFAKYQVDARNADQVAQDIGGPISKQSIASLQAIHAPTPADYAADPSRALAEQAAYQAAQSEIAQFNKDPAAWRMSQEGVRVKGGGKAGATDPDQANLTTLLYGTDAQHPGFANSGQVDLQKGSAFAANMLQSQVSRGADPNGQNIRLLPEALAAQKVESFEKAPPEGKYDAGLALRAFVDSFPSQLALAHGVVVSPRLLAARELAQAGMKQGDIAAIIDSSDSPAGKIAYGRYVAATNDPELKKPLPAQQGKALYQAVQQAIGKYQATNLSPGDSWLNAGREDQIYAQARQIMATAPGTNPNVAANQAAAYLTSSAFRFEGALRMPLDQANATFQTHPAAPGLMDIARTGAALAFGQPGLAPRGVLGQSLSGWDAAHQGLAAARSWAAVGDGANLSAPPSELSIGDSKKQYAGIIARSGIWSNIGDNQVALMVPRPDGQMEMVTDKYGRSISMSFQQAIADGQSGHSLFERPAPPTAALSTPEGHPIHATTAPIGAAALAGSIAAHSQGAPAADPNAPQPVPMNAPPPSPPEAAGTAMNATQRALAAVGASSQVQAMFAGPAAAGNAESAAPMGYEGLNVTPSKAVQLLLPNVIHRESGGVGGQTSPKGAVGLMQLMPDTVKDWAPRIGLPVDMDRALHDSTYNQAIGTALLNSLTQHYMKGAVPNAGVALALAAYNAGPGRVEGSTRNGVHTPGWLTTIGDPRAGQMSTDEWISKIPFKETRDYVRAIMDRTTRRLAGVVGAGPPA